MGYVSPPSPVSYVDMMDYATSDIAEAVWTYEPDESVEAPPNVVRREGLDFPKVIFGNLRVDWFRRLFKKQTIQDEMRTQREKVIK